MIEKRNILIVCNSTAATYNFRSSYIKALKEKGYRITCLSFAEHRFGEELKELCDGESYICKLSVLSPQNILKAISIVRASDFIHSFTHPANLFALVFAKRSQRLVCTVTGLGRLWASDALHAKIARWLVTAVYSVFHTKATSYIFQNQDDLEFFRSQVLSSQKYIGIRTFATPGSGIELPRYEPYRKDVFPDTVKTVGFFSRADSLKGVSDFYRIACELKGMARFIHAGHPGNGDFDALRIKQTACESGVDYVGVLDKPEEMIAMCDVVIIPSRYREGVPRLLLECFALGVPVISYGGPGISDHIKNNVNSFIVDDEKKVLKLLINLDGEKLKEISKSQVDYANRHFSVAIVTGIYCKALFE